MSMPHSGTCTCPDCRALDEFEPNQFAAPAHAALVTQLEEAQAHDARAMLELEAAEARVRELETWGNDLHAQWTKAESECAALRAEVADKAGTELNQYDEPATAPARTETEPNTHRRGCVCVRCEAEQAVLDATAKAFIYQDTRGAAVFAIPSEEGDICRAEIARREPKRG